ncbi:MAG: hypothetical protein ACOYXT_04845 [Bacteroidota bacterium]
MMQKLLTFYRTLNVLSLDIVAGSVVSALFFSRVFQVHIRPYGLLALGLSVWIIYTVDHLRDARNIAGHASTERHRFHQKYFMWLLWVVIAAMLVDAVVIIFIRKQVFQWGVGLAGVVMIYLLVQRYLRFMKEIFVAVLYTCGVLLPSLSVTLTDVAWYHALLVVQFALVALINLLMFSWFDRDKDQKDKQSSFVTMVGERATRYTIWSLLLINFTITICLLFRATNFFFAVMLTMNMALMIIFIFRTWAAHDDRYRLLGDSVFMFPVFCL